MFIETIRIDQKPNGTFGVSIVPHFENREDIEHLDAGIYGGLYHARQGQTEQKINKLIDEMILRNNEQIEDCNKNIVALKKLRSENE